MSKQPLLIFALCFMFVFPAGCTDDNTKDEDTTASYSQSTIQASSPAVQWYQGGTLHNQSALEWQTASAADKLATCCDFVTTMWKNNDLNAEVSDKLATVDDVRPYAQELVNFLDTAFRLDPDPEQNRKLFTNQTVSSTAAIGMVTMGWTK